MRTSRRGSAAAAVAAAVLLLSLNGEARAQEREQAFALAASCAACHGTDGVSPGTIPRLDQRSPSFIENALLAFKSGERTGTVMNRLARGYTDDEIRLLASYFGAAQ